MRKDRGINRWELVTCALAGHVTYAPDESDLADRLSGTTGLGEVWRCLRCGVFTPGAPHGRGRAEDAPMIMRGKALRQAIIIRLLAIERLLRAVVIALAAYAVWKFRGARGAIQSTLDRDLPIFRAAGFKVDQMTIVHELEKALAAKPSTLALLTLMLVGYALIVETIFRWPGVGYLLVDSIIRRDYPVAQFFSLLLILFVLLANWFADIAYGLANPRIRVA